MKRILLWEEDTHVRASGIRLEQCLPRRGGQEALLMGRAAEMGNSDKNQG